MVELLTEASFHEILLCSTLVLENTIVLQIVLQTWAYFCLVFDRWQDCVHRILKRFMISFFDKEIHDLFFLFQVANGSFKISFLLIDFYLVICHHSNFFSFC